MSTRAGAAVFAMEHGLTTHPGHLTVHDRRGLTLLSMLAADRFKLLLLRPEGVLQGPCRFRWWAELSAEARMVGG